MVHTYISIYIYHNVCIYIHVHNNIHTCNIVQHKLAPPSRVRENRIHVVLLVSACLTVASFHDYWVVWINLGMRYGLFQPMFLDLFLHVFQLLVGYSRRPGGPSLVTLQLLFDRLLCTILPSGSLSGYRWHRSRATPGCSHGIHEGSSSSTEVHSARSKELGLRFAWLLWIHR